MAKPEAHFHLPKHHSDLFCRDLNIAPHFINSKTRPCGPTVVLLASRVFWIIPCPALTWVCLFKDKFFQIFTGHQNLPLLCPILSYFYRWTLRFLCFIVYLRLFPKATYVSKENPWEVFPHRRNREWSEIEILQQDHKRTAQQGTFGLAPSKQIHDTNNKYLVQYTLMFSIKIPWI